MRSKKSSFMKGRDNNSSINSFHFSRDGQSNAEKDENSENVLSQASGLSGMKSVSTFKDIRSKNSSYSKGTKKTKSKNQMIDDFSSVNSSIKKGRPSAVTSSYN